MKIRGTPISTAALLAVLSVPALAAGADDLQFFEEEAKVLTASRRLERVSEAPVAVEIVTAEEIRRSGAVNLWDFMRFRAGMNVVDGRSGEGNRALVSVRGFPAEFVDNMLVLVDGRSVYTALSGGAVWEELPVQIQDIDRIEIVRGPNAALYGSNAGLGVINIITRKPGERSLYAAGLGGARVLNREDAFVEDAGKNGAWRLSASHKEQEGNPTTYGATGQDYLFSNKGNFRGVWTPAPGHALEAFAGGAWQNVGVIETGNPTGRFRHHFEILKHAYDAGPDSSVQTTLARRDDVRTYDQPGGGRLVVREYQYDAETSHRLDWLAGDLHTVYGASLRYTGLDSTQLFAAHPYQKNAVSRGFLSQSWRVLPRLNLIGALSVEHSDTGGTEPAYNLAAVSAVSEGQTVRVSHGLAPTIPTLYDKAARQLANASTLLVGNPGMAPQRLRSTEVSYQGQFADNRMSFETNLFYMTVSNLGRTVFQSFTFAPGPLVTLSFDNGNDAIARGAEVKWGWRWSARRSVYANYTYETISDGVGLTNVRHGTPPHKINLGGTTSLPAGFALNLDAGYQDAHILSSQALNQTANIAPYWRLDGRLAYAVRPGAEVFVACQNMLKDRHVEFADGLVVPRVVSGGASVKF